jgi:purine-binding chemotaxis protein CheW
VSDNLDVTNTGWLLVITGGVRVALPQALVREVVRSQALPTYTTVPGAPSFVRGLTSLRGRPVAVVQLAKLLGLPSAAPQTSGLAACMVVQGFDTEQLARPPLAMEVERVLRIVDARHFRLDAAPSFGGLLPTAWLRGVLTIDDQPVPALDLPTLLNTMTRSVQPQQTSAHATG